MQRGEEAWLCVLSDSSGLIKETEAPLIFWSACLRPVRRWLRLVHMLLFDGWGFDSLLPVSVKAELNVN